MRCRARKAKRGSGTELKCDTGQKPYREFGTGIFSRPQKTCRPILFFPDWMSLSRHKNRGFLFQKYCFNTFEHCRPEKMHSKCGLHFRMRMSRRSACGFASFRMRKSLQNLPAPAQAIRQTVIESAFENLLLFAARPARCALCRFESFLCRAKSAKCSSRAKILLLIQPLHARPDPLHGTHS